MTIAEQRQQWLKFNSFQAKMENKFIPIVLHPLQSAVNAFVERGLKGLDDIGIASRLVPILNNLYYQTGYSWGYSVYRKYKNVKQAVTPEDIAREVVNELRLSLLTNVNGIEASVKEAILAKIQQGQANGWAYDKTASEVKGVANLARSQRIVRTESVKAANLSAILGARRTGITMNKKWISAKDRRVRGNPIGKYPLSEFDHWDMNGQEVPMDRPFFLGSRTGASDELQYPGDPKGQPGDIINCFPEDTLCEGQIVSGQRLKYAGKLIEIITASGKRLSVTPNHPVFTSVGTKKAMLLKNGDYVMANIKKIDASNPLRNNYIHQEPIKAADIFSTLNNFASSEQIMITSLDFDGDGEFGNGNIDIVDMNRELDFGSIIPFQDLGKFDFECTGLERIFISRFCSQFQFADTSFATFNSSMSRGNLFPSFNGRHFRPFKFFSVGTSTNWNASRYDSSGQYAAFDSAFIRKLFEGNAGNIEFDEIVEIRDYDFVGHVYDFSTLTGAILLNNIYNSNCRCVCAFVPQRDVNGRVIRIAPGFMGHLVASKLVTS